MLTRLNRLTKPFSNVLLICFSLATINIFAQQVLKPQDAFPVEVAYQNNVIQISHQIKDGYYLYKDKISYSSLDSRILLGTTTLPEGIKYEDEFFGKTETDGIGYPILLTILNLPSILFEIFPFIILITTQFFLLNFKLMKKY